MKEGVSPFVFAFYRELLACMMMFLIVKYVSKQRIYILPEDRLRFFVLGFFSFVNVVGAMLSLNYISPTRFAIFQPCIPCIASVISVLIGLESFTFLKLLGVALAVGGAILTETWKDGDDGGDEEKDVTLGSIIVSLQVTAMACLVVFVKPILPKYPSTVTTLGYYSIGTLYTALLFLILSFTFTTSDLVFDGALFPWLGLAFVATFATVYPYNALSWGVRHLSPSTTTVYSTFQPVGTVILSLIFLGKVVTSPELVGGAMVAIGLAVTVYAQSQERKGGDGDGEGSSGGDIEKDLLADHYSLVGENDSERVSGGYSQVPID